MSYRPIDARPSPFTALARGYDRRGDSNSRCGRVRALAHCFAVSHGDWEHVYAATRVLESMGTHLLLSSYIRGCRFDGWDADDNLDAEILRDLAIDYLERDES